MKPKYRVMLKAIFCTAGAFSTNPRAGIGEGRPKLRFFPIQRVNDKGHVRQFGVRVCGLPDVYRSVIYEFFNERPK